MSYKQIDKQLEVVKIVMERSGLNDDYYPVFIDSNGNRWIHILGQPNSISYWAKEKK